MKNQRGITLMVLVITIVVIFIIAGITIYSGIESVESAREIAFISEMEMIQAKVNAIHEEIKNDTSKIQYYDTIGQELSLIDENKLNTIFGETSRNGFRYFQSSQLDNIGLTNISQEVLINYNTREVISLNGIKIEGIIYYKLKDIPDYLNSNIEYKNPNTLAPTFTVKQTQTGSSQWRFTLKDILYNSEVKGGTVSYKLHSDTNWKLNGDNTIINVTQPGLYDIKLTDNAGNATIKQSWIYIEDGLILRYDGEDNTGTGHSNTATTWKDLSKRNNDLILNSNHTFGDNSLNCSGTYGTYSISTEDVFPEEANNYSIEVVAKYNNSNSGWIYSIRDTENIEGIQLYQYDMSNAQRFAMYSYDEETNIVNFAPKVQTVFNRTITYNKLRKLLIAYENSNLVENITSKHAILQSKKLQVGGVKWNEGVSLDGSIYTIRIYNRVLTQEEIKLNYEIDKYRFGIIE